MQEKRDPTATAVLKKGRKEENNVLLQCVGLKCNLR